MEMNVALPAIVGKVFASPVTGREYGVIRRLQGDMPVDVPREGPWTPFAEDECGNYLMLSEAGPVGLWDHETATIETIAESLTDLYERCTQARPAELKPEQVRSARIDPEFARQIGMDSTPPEGGIKRSSK